MGLVTNTPYWNDLCDVVRLFYGDAPISMEEGSSHELRIRHESLPGQENVYIAMPGGEYALWQELSSDVAGEGLAAKRMHKRAAKNALYRALWEITKVHPPWGSLTGIRPTRLLVEALQANEDMDGALAAMERDFDVQRDKLLLLADIVTEQRSVPAPRSDQCDIYVGIPFCSTRCSYCSFAAMGMDQGRNFVAPYLAALHEEIKAAALLLRQSHMQARAVYVGGGTPTSLSAGQMDDLLVLLRSLFPDALEWTVEAGRPDTIDREKLQVIGGHGVRRISVNPQTMHDRTLAAIGRNHSARDIVLSMALAREMGFDLINMDLIAGLPGEGAADLLSSVEQVIAMEPENITLHTLAVKRASQMRISGQAELPCGEDARLMVDGAAELLRRGGYKPYYLYRQKYMAGNLENVGYTLPGRACMYNIDNMEEIAPVLACGAGAISKWLFPGERRIERAPNVKNVQEYIARIGEMIGRKESLIRGEKHEMD